MADEIAGASARDIPPADKAPQGAGAAIAVEVGLVRVGAEVHLNILVGEAPLPGEGQRKCCSVSILVGQLVGAMGSSHNPVAGAVGDDEAAGADIPPAGDAADAFHTAAAVDAQVRFDQLVDDHPHGNAADMLGTVSDRSQAEPLGVGARHEKHHLSSPLVVTGAPRSGQLLVEIDEMLAHRVNRLGMRGSGPGMKDDRHPCSAAVCDGIVPGQQDDDPVGGGMLDRNAGQPVPELAGDRVRRRHGRLLGLQPLHR